MTFGLPFGLPGDLSCNTYLLFRNLNVSIGLNVLEFLYASISFKDLLLHESHVWHPNLPLSTKKRTITIISTTKTVIPMPTFKDFIYN